MRSIVATPTDKGVPENLDQSSLSGSNLGKGLASSSASDLLYSSIISTSDESPNNIASSIETRPVRSLPFRQFTSTHAAFRCYDCVEHGCNFDLRSFENRFVEQHQAAFFQRSVEHGIPPTRRKEGAGEAADQLLSNCQLRFDFRPEAVGVEKRAVQDAVRLLWCLLRWW